MKLSMLSKNYAKAIYEVSVDNRTQDRVINELRALNDLFTQDASVWEFLTSPLVTDSERVNVVEKALNNKGLSKDTVDLLLLLARKDRLSLFPEIVLAYEAQSDEANNVCRGTVRSATALGQAERQQIENTVERVLNKKVIMNYKVDPAVIGGLVAQVGTFTFDDSIDSHLKRMNEELKRRTV